MASTERKSPIKGLGSNQVTYSITFVANGALAPSAVYDSCDSKVKASVAAPSPAGVYEVQLPQVGSGYPSEIFCIPGVADTVANIPGDAQASYIAGSYSSTTGRFKVAYLEAGLLVNAPAGVEITMLLHMRIGKAGKQR